LEVEGKQVEEKDQINFTDPDSRLITTNKEGTQQYYNGQMVVDE